MLSLETARKLKGAGLKWKPSIGDQYRELLYEKLTQIYDADPINEYRIKKSIWLPRLDQLLAEIEKRGYGYELTSYPASYFAELGDSFPITYKLKLFDEVGLEKEFGDCANVFSSEEAAAQALIWILEQEGIHD